MRPGRERDAIFAICDGLWLNAMRVSILRCGSTLAVYKAKNGKRITYQGGILRR